MPKPAIAIQHPAHRPVLVVLCLVLIIALAAALGGIITLIWLHPTSFGILMALIAAVVGGVAAFGEDVR